MGEAKFEPLRVNFDRRLEFEYHCSYISRAGDIALGRAVDVRVD